MELGFVCVGEMSDGQESEYQMVLDNSDDFYTITRDFDNIYKIEFEKNTGKNLHTPFTLFDGKIKNKSELQKLLIQLGIKHVI